MVVLVKLVRTRLRVAVKIATRVSEALDLLGLDFLAVVARTVMFVALLSLLLLDLLVRASVQLSVATFRFLRVRAGALVKAVILALSVVLMVSYPSGNGMHSFLAKRLAQAVESLGI